MFTYCFKDCEPVFNHCTNVLSVWQGGKGKLAVLGSCHMFSDLYIDKEENSKILVRLISLNLCTYTYTSDSMCVWHFNVVASTLVVLIDEVTLCQVQLLLGWMTVHWQVNHLGP